MQYKTDKSLFLYLSKAPSNNKAVIPYFKAPSSNNKMIFLIRALYCRDVKHTANYITCRSALSASVIFHICLRVSSPALLEGHYSAS